MIIWFSGSGNSLAIAQKIADKTGEQMLPIYEAVRMDLSAEKRGSRREQPKRRAL